MADGDVAGVVLAEDEIDEILARHGLPTSRERARERAEPRAVTRRDPPLRVTGMTHVRSVDADRNRRELSGIAADYRRVDPAPRLPPPPVAFKNWLADLRLPRVSARGWLIVGPFLLIGILWIFSLLGFEVAPSSKPQSQALSERPAAPANRPLHQDIPRPQGMSSLDTMQPVEKLRADQIAYLCHPAPEVTSKGERLNRIGQYLAIKGGQIFCFEQEGWRAERHRLFDISAVLENERSQLRCADAFSIRDEGRPRCVIRK